MEIENELAAQIKRLEELFANQANEYSRLESDIEEQEQAVKDANTKIEEKAQRMADLKGVVEAGKISMAIIQEFVSRSLLKDQVAKVLYDLETQTDPDIDAACTSLGIEPYKSVEGEKIEYGEEEQQELDVSTG